MWGHRPGSINFALPFLLRTIELKRRHLSSNGKKTGSGEDEEKKKTEIEMAPPVGVLEIFKFAGNNSYYVRFLLLFITPNV